MSILILPDRLMKRKTSIQIDGGLILVCPVHLPGKNQINNFPFRYEITTLNVKCHFEILEVFSKTEDNLCNSNNIITIIISVLSYKKNGPLFAYLFKNLQ